MRGHRWLGIILVTAALLAACTSGQRPTGMDSVIQPGLGVFTFDDYRPLKDRPVRVFYDAPAHLDTAQILIVMHGVGRKAEEYRADWRAIVDSRNVLVLVPEFSEEQYPGSESYALGNTVDPDGTPVPEDQWSFHVVEALFDYVVREAGSSARDYALFGHSAGAQFVHRFIEFMPTHRARIAVAANAGWYTIPDDSITFPYGLGEAPSAVDLHRVFNTNLVVLLGADDIDTDAQSLRRSHQSDEQGENRLERGLNFYRRSRDIAAKESIDFRWRLTVVPGISHSHADISAVAAPFILGDVR
jgi:poly(3-hydroxybutyrate) depolymerase